MESEQLKSLVLESLEEMKARDVVVLPVANMTSVTDWMIVASGTSNRHVKSLADKVAQDAKDNGEPALGIEGADAAEWVLVDFGAGIVHIMLPATRAFYALERLWTVKPGDAIASDAGNDSDDSVTNA